MNKKLKIIIGNNAYPDDEIICKTSNLKKYECYKFYRYFNEVAFVTNKVYPHKFAFENILNLIYYNHNINVRKKYYKIIKDIGWEKFVDYLYKVENIVLINQVEINVNMLKKTSKNYNSFKYQMVENAASILTCGKEAKTKMNNIEKYYFFRDVLKVSNSVHPSPHRTTLQDRKYVHDWVCINSANNYKKDFMIN